MDYRDIHSDNFSDYFFDVRTHKPEKGQVIAKFTAVCELIAGEEKKFLISLLKRSESALSVANMMVKVFCADELSSWRTPIEMAKDLLNGMTEEEVNAKEYEFTGQFFFYTLPQYVPPDDPHWEIIEIL